jgi:alkylation response protein AidB-like acyl-CoA dehydrogenase
MKYLKPLASGEVIGAFALSEPEAGSDATSQSNSRG